MSDSLRRYYSGSAVVLAPMEDISDPVFRKICRELGSDLCFTEFINVDSMLKGDLRSRRKMRLEPDDRPTAIQIYGENPATLVEAAVLAEAAGAAFIDVNCGCWVPKITARGAGAGWLRDPARMVEMAARLVKSVSLPVSIKTRIGWGPESDMPIVELARRLEDVGVAAITVHCRTALMRHDGAADWSWAKKAQEGVNIPVLVNGDVRTAADCKRALEETGCAGVMIGRAAIDYPWVFREAKALLSRGELLAPPDDHERLSFLMSLLKANVAYRGALKGMFCTRRHYAGVLAPVEGGGAIKAALYATTDHERCLEILDAARSSRRAA